MANIYSIQDSNGREITNERQIYSARTTAQAVADKTGREVSFQSDSGREVFKPRGK